MKVTVSVREVFRVFADTDGDRAVWASYRCSHCGETRWYYYELESNVTYDARLHLSECVGDVAFA